MLAYFASLRQPPSCLQLLVMRAALTLLVLVASAPPALAQSEDRLRVFFEGKTVRLKMEMPGTEDGVDVYPGTAHPIDFPKHATRLKRSGTALRRGDEVLVTKVKVKKDLIALQPSLQSGRAVRGAHPRRRDASAGGVRGFRADRRRARTGTGAQGRES